MSSDLRKCDLRWMIFRLALVLIVSILLVSPCMSENRVELRLPTDCCVDTLRPGTIYKLEYWIENDVKLGSMSLGFEVYSPDGAEWTWQEQIEGYGPDGKNSGLKLVEVAPGSRMDPSEVAWESDLQVIETDLDGISPDSFLFSAQADTAGLEPGSLEHMMSMYFTVEGGYGEAQTICFDSVFIPPDGDWLFTDAMSDPLIPDFGGTQCWPVKYYAGPPLTHDCPDETLTTNHCEPISYDVAFDHLEGDPMTIVETGNTGYGWVSIDDDGDGSASVTYHPMGYDNYSTVEVTVEGQTPFGCVGCCTASIAVTNNYPVLEVGNDASAFYGHIFVNTGILASDLDPCDDLTVGIAYGPGSIDPETGIYIWTPEIGDVGLNIVEVYATDGYSEARAAFTVEVVACGRCISGDANFDGDVNVGDAVVLINFVFKGASYPHVPDLADANGDCSLNVGDAVYLINYVFKGGDPPQMGCIIWE
ncbi:MAG: hypothetical protein GY841_13745 [FCB group bacterium]|nr:hypothetical protein [FCB group bacterium]